jgi:hypothetical protein
MEQAEANTMGAVNAKQQFGNVQPIARPVSMAARSSASSLIPPSLAENGGAGEPLPIWLAVLMATSCRAQSNDSNHDVRWDRVAGRALYTNFGRDAERIEPLGVSLSVGETLAVYWNPGETAYTMEVYSQTEKCA